MPNLLVPCVARESELLSPDSVELEVPPRRVEEITSGGLR